MKKTITELMAAGELGIFSEEASAEFESRIREIIREEIKSSPERLLQFNPRVDAPNHIKVEPTPFSINMPQQAAPVVNVEAAKADPVISALLSKMSSFMADLVLIERGESKRMDDLRQSILVLAESLKAPRSRSIKIKRDEKTGLLIGGDISEVDA